MNVCAGVRNKYANEGLAKPRRGRHATASGGSHQYQSSEFGTGRLRDTASSSTQATSSSLTNAGSGATRPNMAKYAFSACRSRLWTIRDICSRGIRYWRRSNLDTCGLRSRCGGFSDFPMKNGIEKKLLNCQVNCGCYVDRPVFNVWIWMDPRVRVRHISRGLRLVLATEGRLALQQT